MSLIAGKRMNTVAGYSLVRPIEIGVRESSWAVEGEGGTTRIVEICERFDDTEASGDALGSFFERARLQRRVAAATGKGPGGLGLGHAAGVHAEGATPWGGYLVRDAYSISAADLIAGKVRIRGDALHEIIAGVVTALGLYAEAGGRRHGDLVAASVLLSDDKPGRVRVGLHRPADALAYSGLANAAGDEMRRLGQLIFELVLHRPFREMGGYPVRDGPEWQRLGKTGGFWLGLVNELLEPRGCGLSLEEVAARIGGQRFKVDGPGVGVYLGRGLAAAAVVLVVGGGVLWFARPRPQPQLREFKQPTFEKWLEITPVVASLRAGISERDGEAPAAVVRALGALDVTDEDRGGFKTPLKDFFDVPQVFSEADFDFRRSMDKPISVLVDDLEEFVQSDLDSRVGEEGDPEPKEGSDQYKIERLAALYEDGLERFVGSEDRPGVLGGLSTEAWPARGLIEGVTAGGEFDWMRESGRELFSGSVDTVNSWVDGFGDDGGPGLFDGGFKASDPLSEGRLESVERFLDAATEIEEAAAVVGAWKDELYPAIETGSESVSAKAGWPALHASVLRRLDGDRDAFLASFEGFAQRVGVVGAGEGIRELDVRLRDSVSVIKDIDEYLGAGWDIERTDLIQVSKWLDMARERIEERPAEGDDVSTAAWVDARVGLGREWLEAVGSAGVVTESDWPAILFLDELEATRKLWNEVAAAEPELTKEAEIKAFDRFGFVHYRLGEFEARVKELLAFPRWESLLDEVNSEHGLIGSEIDEFAQKIESIHSVLMQDPRELVDSWPKDLPGFVAGNEAFADARARIGESVIRVWRESPGGPGADEETMKRSADTDALRVSLRGIDDVLQRAWERVDALVDGERAFGGFDIHAIRGRARVLVAEGFADSLTNDGPWGDRPAYKDDRYFDGVLDEAEALWLASLDALDSDLGVLGEAVGGIARGRVAGESYGAGRVADAGELRGFAGRLRGESAELIEGVGDVQEALRSVEGLLEIGTLADATALVNRFVDESGTDSHAGLAVAAIRRLDGLGIDGSVWPGRVEGLAGQSEVLRDGLSALRAGLDEADWDRLSAGDEGGRGLRTVIQEWWLRGVGLAGTRQSFASVVDGASGWFDGIEGEWDGLLGASLLQGRGRYNARSVEIRREIDRLAGKAIAAGVGKSGAEIQRLDTELRRNIESELNKLDSAAGATLDDAEARAARGWMDGLRGVLRDAAGGRAGWDPASFGPVGVDGFAGWTHSLNDSVDPPVLTYSNANGSQRVEFVLVSDLPSGGQVFLAKDEVSVSLCGEILRERGSFIGDDALGVWYEVVGRNRSGNLVEGPSSREVFTRGTNAKRYRLSSRKKWLTGDVYGAEQRDVSFPAYPGQLRGAAFDEISSDQGSPDGTHPVNYIRGSLAAGIARAFGCRLPTDEEFRAALGKVPGPRSGRWNLRDETFLAQQANHRAAIAFGVTTHYKPGLWSYDGTDGNNLTIWDTASGRDGKLWFYKTDGEDAAFQQGILFQHLVGNVGEFVGLTDSASTLSEIRVMGASALSDPNVQPGDVMPADVGSGTRNGFVDVGFRLAIDADDFGSLGKLVQKEIIKTESVAFVSGVKE